MYKNTAYIYTPKIIEDRTALIELLLKLSEDYPTRIDDDLLRFNLNFNCVSIVEMNNTHNHSISAHKVIKHNSAYKITIIHSFEEFKTLLFKAIVLS